MKKSLGILLLSFILYGCATTIEPSSQTNNPAKVDNTIKIVYSDPYEIYIMKTGNPFALNPNNYEHYDKKPENRFIKTAFNHCSIYKKNTYYIYKMSASLPKGSIFNNGYKIVRAISSKRAYEWARYNYNNKNYEAYRFVCANKVNQALDIYPSLRLYNNWQGFYVHKGHRVASEKKRILSDEEIAENKRKGLEEKKRIAKLEKQRRAALIEILENEYGNVCLKTENNNKFLKGTVDFENCLIEHDKKIIAQKREADELRKQKQRELEEKLAKMSPTERHAYNCTETFNFKKSTEKFNDCVFKLYTAELDIQKLELEKQVAEANAKAASNEQLRAEALVKAQIAAANASARAANLNSSMQLMKLSEQLIKGNQQKNPFNTKNVRVKTTCSNVGGFLSCF